MSSNHPAIRLLVVDDDAELREMMVRWFQRHGHAVREAANAADALKALVQERFDVALLDLNLPDMSGVDLLEKLKAAQPEAEAIMLTAHGSIETAIQAMKRGAYDYLTKPFQFAEIDVHLHKAFEKVQLARRHRQWLEQVRYESPRYRLVGTGLAMRKVVQLIERVAPTEATVLIRGPSGTGKELVARAIHHNSPRRDRPLVTINCASLQETLLESELFGHEKGSFTGATKDKPGLFEVAEGGTLFVDEVAEMSPGLQAKLLRVLEDRRFRRVGGTQEIQADVRLIAATNKPLEEEIKAGKFRQDLFYRLNVVSITLPSLKDRREDVPHLVEHFLATRPVGPTRCTIEPEALAVLCAYDWPGNVRELANVIERAQILAEEHTITLDDLPEALVESVPAGVALPSTDPHSLREVERRHVGEVLEQSHGNKVQAAKALGISRRALYRLLKKYGFLNATAEETAAG